MKKKIIERYDRDKNGSIIIKISAKHMEDLYDHFDKSSSFVKKDLNSELVNYMIESVSEIGSEKFIIKFYLENRADDISQEKIRESIHNFFEYLEELERKKMNQQIKNSIIFTLLGFLFVGISIFMDRNEGMVSKVLAEGVMVAGWVSLWEAVATFLIKWFPHSKKFKIFKRVSLSHVEFE